VQGFVCVVICLFAKRFASFAPKFAMLAQQNVKNMKKIYAKLVLKPVASALMLVVSAVKEMGGMSNPPIPSSNF